MHIGRKKSRDSSLIRRLYKNGATYSQIAKLANCSTGSVSAEIRIFKKELSEKEELDKTIREREYKTIKEELERAQAKMASLQHKIPPEKRNSIGISQHGPETTRANEILETV